MLFLFMQISFWIGLSAVLGGVIGWWIRDIMKERQYHAQASSRTLSFPAANFLTSYFTSARAAITQATRSHSYDNLPKKPKVRKSEASFDSQDQQASAAPQVIAAQASKEQANPSKTRINQNITLKKEQKLKTTGTFKVIDETTGLTTTQKTKAIEDKAQEQKTKASLSKTRRFRSVKPEASKATKATPKPSKTQQMRAIKQKEMKQKEFEKIRAMGIAKQQQLDNLQMITGIGPVIEKNLQKNGITSIDQIAKFNDKDVDWANTKLKLKGRIQRQDWIGQAKQLQKKKSPKEQMVS